MDLDPLLQDALHDPAVLRERTHLSDSAGTSGATDTVEAGARAAAEPEVPDLTGVWESTQDSAFSQQAVIAGSAITVD